MHEPMATAEALAQKIAGQGEGFDIKFGDLENLQDLSSGNFGKVYRGTYLGTPVAVKKLLDVDDEFMHKYIEREMGILRCDFNHMSLFWRGGPIGLASFLSFAILSFVY